MNTSETRWGREGAEGGDGANGEGEVRRLDSGTQMNCCSGGQRVRKRSAQTVRRSLTVVAAWEGSIGRQNGKLRGTLVGLERGQRGSARRAESIVRERPGLSMGETNCVEVMNAPGGGYGFHARDWVLANCAGFLGRGLPQLEHGVLGEPIDLAPLNGVVLGASE